MLNKKDHSDSLIWTDQSHLIYFFNSEKSSYLIWKSSPQNLEDNSCSRDLELGLFELSLKLWIRKIYIRQYLLNQVSGMVMESWIMSLWERQRPLSRPPCPPSTPG